VAVIILNANTAVAWVAAISTIGSPTAAELNGGTRLETLLRSDGLTIGVTNNKTPAGNLGTIYEWERFSTVAYAIKLAFHHDTVADTAWALFPRKTSGYLACRRGLARATTFATGQGNGGANGTLQIWQVECGSSDEVDPPNDWDFELDFAMIADPAERAVVA
jgi:hypothetical protein